MAIQMKEKEPGGPGKCVCPDCDYEVDKKRGTPCRSMECPECGAALVAATEEVEEMPMTDVRQIAASAVETALAVVNGSGEITRERASKLLYALEADLDATSTVPVAEAASFDVDGERVTLAELVAVYREAVTKTIAGKPRPAGDFLVVEDPEKPTSWHLPVKMNGKPDHRLMGGAWAALHGGYRGQKYEGPDKAKAIAKLKALYKSEDMPLPLGEVGMSELRALLTRALDMLSEDAAEAEVAELSESASGAVIGLAEDIALHEGGSRAPLLLDVALIEPGFGNKKQNHYYSAAMLKRDAKVFEGIKMYATDHRADEKSVRTEVSTIKTIVGFTDSGAPIARVAIHDPDFAEATRNRARLDTLSSLECSILAKGRTRKGEIDGRKANVVEAITSAQSVDWVSAAGAGGRVLNLAESTEGGDQMSDEQKEAVEAAKTETVAVKEAILAEGEQEQKVTLLAESDVETALAETNLPQFAKTALAAGEYTDAATLQIAIAEAIAEVKKLTGSGQVFGQGQTEPVAEMTFEEREQARTDRFNTRCREVGIAEV